MKSVSLLLVTTGLLSLSACTSASHPSSQPAKRGPLLSANRGSLIVASTPTSAEISISDIGVTDTPLNMHEIVPGTYLVTLSHAGFLPEQRKVEIKAGETTDLGIVLLRPISPPVPVPPPAPPVAPAPRPPAVSTAFSAPVAAPQAQPTLQASRSGNKVSLNWVLPEAEGGYRSIEVMRNTTDAATGRTRIRAVRATVTQLEDSLPDPAARYWYWLKLTQTEGRVINLGPVPATPTP